MLNRVYVAIDLKSFYASVECVERGLDPLSTNLVVADESRTSKTICLAVTPSLKAYGLSGRSRLFEVEQKVKQIKKQTGRTIEYITAVPRMSLYITYSARIYEVYMKYISPEDIHVYSIDEVFMDVTDYLSMYNMTAKELASKIINDVYETTGITATAGIGTNMYLSKIAMDIIAKHTTPDANGVRIAELDEMTYRKRLWDYKPITDFWRIGPGIAKRLNDNGMYTMGDVASVSLINEKWLFKIFGIDAEMLIDHAWGHEPCEIRYIKNYKPRTNSISSGQVLHEPYENDKAKIIIKEMAEQLALDLVDKGLVTDSVTVNIGYDKNSVEDGSYKGNIQVDRYGRTVPKSAHGTINLGTTTSSTKKIVDKAVGLFDEISDKNLFVRRINITANNVIEEMYEQYDIFTDPVAREKERNMQKAVLSLQKKFGKNAILKGIDLEEGATTMDRNNQVGGHKA